jgi:hypothetical protein
VILFSLKATRVKKIDLELAGFEPAVSPSMQIPCTYANTRGMPSHRCNLREGTEYANTSSTSSALYH